MRALSTQLRRTADDIWRAQHAHPFVRGIGDGTLDPQLFSFWIRQDYLFLTEYSRLCAVAAARSPDLTTMARFSDLLHETLHVEMDLHRSYSAELGISADLLEMEEMAPTTRGYVDYLLRTATVGDFSELVTALLPCMWGFNEIGLRLHQDGLPADRGYAKWIAMYSSEEFTSLVDWLRDLTDRLGEEIAGSALDRVEEAFLTSSRYELAFWEMAWKQEWWPSI